MKTITFLLSALLCLSLQLSANPYKDFERKLERAEILYKGGNYSDALSMYLEIFRNDTTNLNVSYKIGVCYLHTGKSYAKAVPYLLRASKGAATDYIDDSKREKRAPILAHKQLGDAYHMTYKFDEAIESYQKYKQSVRSHRLTEKEIVQEVERKIMMCNVGKELVAHPADVKIVNLGKTVNSPYPDYAPRLSADQSTMIFTSRRPENTGGKTFDGGQYFEDIYIATRKGKEWQPAVNIGWPINTVGNEAAIGISADGQEILIYKDDMGDGNIYSSKLDGDKWTTPEKLNSNINSKYWEPGAFLSADGQTLYFVSDRPGGYGGTDIYKSRKMANGDWGKAVNLGPTINSPYDEHSPYIHPDGVTLYFSSKGHKTMGGYDIFFSHTLLSDDKIWVEPTNVGYPINTTADDAFYMVSTDKQSAYYASIREGGLGDKDNYIVTFPDVKEPALSLVKGTVLDSNQLGAKNVVITVRDNETNELEGVYSANSKTGKYLFVLKPGKSHNISYEVDGRLIHTETKYVAEGQKYDEFAKDIRLSELAVGTKVVLNNIFFDFDQSNLRKNSITELDNLYGFLKKYPNVAVEVSGFADSKGSDEYNRKLSLERAQAVVHYLNTKGIDKKRLTAIGHGASAVETGKSNDPSGRETDRRVEIKIVKIK